LTELLKIRSGLFETHSVLFCDGTRRGASMAYYSTFFTLLWKLT